MIDAAIEAAKAGAEILLRHWEHLGRDDADLKSRNDWVSRADRESEKAIVEQLLRHFPNDGILGEEGSGIAGSSGRTWIIDPLDVTSNYLQLFPIWSISIGLRKNDEIIAGVIYEPLRDLVFSAERGAGAFRGDARLHVSDQKTIEGSFLATGFPFRAQKYVALYCDIFENVISHAKGVRRAGSAAIDLAYTAAGVFDVFFELHLSKWDIAAGSLMVTEAGGVMSDFSGGDDWFERGNVVGATPGVHRELMDIIARYTRDEQLAR